MAQPSWFYTSGMNLKRFSSFWTHKLPHKDNLGLEIVPTIQHNKRYVPSTKNTEKEWTVIWVDNGLLSGRLAWAIWFNPWIIIPNPILWAKTCVYSLLWIYSFDNNVVVDILLSTLYAAVHCTGIQKSKWVSKICIYLYLVKFLYYPWNPLNPLQI